MKDHCVRVGLVKIPVRDLKIARQYYRDVLRLEEDFVAERLGWAQYNAVAAPLCIYVPGEGGGTDAPQPGGETGFHLFVKDARGLREKILSRKGNVGPLLTGEDNAVFFVVTDPDGNQFRVIEVRL